MDKKTDYIAPSHLYNLTSENETSESLFNNLIRPKQLALVLGISVATIYDWKYRGKMRNVPDNLFKKLGGTLYVRKDILLDWMSYRQSST